MAKNCKMITLCGSTRFKKKIDLSDEIFVINKNGYIGESTRAEIMYAKNAGKTINYLEK